MALVLSQRFCFVPPANILTHSLSLRLHLRESKCSPSYSRPCSWLQSMHCFNGRRHFSFPLYGSLGTARRGQKPSRGFYPRGQDTMTYSPFRWGRRRRNCFGGKEEILEFWILEFSSQSGGNVRRKRNKNKRSIIPCRRGRRQMLSEASRHFMSQKKFGKKN